MWRGSPAPGGRLAAAGSALPRRRRAWARPGAPACPAAHRASMRQLQEAPSRGMLARQRCLPERTPVVEHQATHTQKKVSFLKENINLTG
jgi:hypothetical protein